MPPGQESCQRPSTNSAGRPLNEATINVLTKPECSHLAVGHSSTCKSDEKPDVVAAFLEEARRRNWTPPAAGSVPAPVRIETASPAPSKPRPKQKPKRKRVRAGSESEGEPSGGDSSSGDEDGDKGKDLLHKLFGDGGEL